MEVIKEIVEFLKGEGVEVVSFEKGYSSNFIEYPTVLAIKIPEEEVGNWNYSLQRYNSQGDKARFTYQEGVCKIAFQVPPRPEFETSLERDLIVFKSQLHKKFFKVCPVEGGVSVIAKATHRCRYNCKYCSDRKNREEMQEDMTFEIVDKTFDLLSKYTRRVTWLWHGGEPTEVSLDWYKYVHENIVPKYPMLDFHFQIMSNGSNYNSEWMEFFEKYCIDPGMSYDVFAHREQRNAGYDMTEMEKRIELARKFNLNLGTITVITSKNYKQLIEMYEYMKTIQISTCFNTFFRTGSPYDNEFDFTDFDDFIAEFMKYFKHWLYDKSGRYERSAVEALAKVVGASPSCCLSTDCRYKWLCLHPTGELYPCDKSLDKSYSLGNVLDYNSISEIFASPSYNRYAAEVEHKYQTYCKSCEIFSVCNGGCSAVYMQNKSEASLMQQRFCEYTLKVFKGVYDLLRDVDIVHNDSLNPVARKLMLTNSFYSVKDILSYIERKGMQFSLEYDEDNLFNCSEYNIFRGINSFKTTCDSSIHCDVYDDYSAEFITYNTEKRFSDLDYYLGRLAQSWVYTEA